MLLCIRLVGKYLQKPHDSCIVFKSREIEGVMCRRTRSRPQFGGLSLPESCAVHVAASRAYSVHDGLLMRSFLG